MDNQNFQNGEQSQMNPPVSQAPMYGVDAPQTAPVMSVKDWMITLLIMLIPFVNIIFLFIWAFGGGENNPNKVNWSKAALIFMAIAIVLNIVLFTIFGAIFASMMGGLGGTNAVY